MGLSGILFIIETIYTLAVREGEELSLPLLFLKMKSNFTSFVSFLFWEILSEIGEQATFYSRISTAAKFERWKALSSIFDEILTHFVIKHPLC